MKNKAYCLKCAHDNIDKNCLKCHGSKHKSLLYKDLLTEDQIIKRSRFTIKYKIYE